MQKKTILILCISAVLVLGAGITYFLQKSAEDSFSPVSLLSTEEQNQSVSNAAVSSNLFYVHVCGAVATPGVYSLPEGSRVFEAVESAGGLMPTADAEALNLAATIYDGMQIFVPFVTDEENGRSKNNRVNLNTADEETLCTLDGIGSGKAKAIISYRERNGAFHSIEEIKNVSGIGDSLFQQIKDRIRV